MRQLWLADWQASESARAKRKYALEAGLIEHHLLSAH
nr:MAG TPA: hypothetical protein [Caudoviricetes sp.]